MIIERESVVLYDHCKAHGMIYTADAAANNNELDIDVAAAARACTTAPCCYVHLEWMRDRGCVESTRTGTLHRRSGFAIRVWARGSW
jgi:hypothetical protein